MRHFHEVLTTLGAIVDEEPLKEAPHWAFWKATYPTPVSNVEGFYLYLKHRCPLREAAPENRRYWSRLAGSSGYEVIVTPRSPLAEDLQSTAADFGGGTARTSRRLLLDSFLQEFTWNPIAGEKYFIDPDLEGRQPGDLHRATSRLMRWIRDSSSTGTSPIAVLVADGGVGKTTVSRVFCHTLQDKGSAIIPILIESAQWRHLLDKGVTMDTVWDLAISCRFEHASRLLANKTALRVLIREGLFVVVFDGFDELCVNPHSVLRPKDVIDDLMDMVSSPEDDDARARIIVTSRRTYWDSVSEEIDAASLDVFRLKGFDNDQRKRYYAARLKDPAERDVALRLAKQISGGIYANLDVEDEHEDRPSGVPFILDLIAGYVEGNPDVNVNPYQTDPFGHLLLDICRREKERQALDIDPNAQLEFFEELFREYPDSFSLDDLRLFLGVICDVEDEQQVQRFTNHVFLSRLGNELYGPRYEVLRVYFIARFLAFSLQEMIGSEKRQKIAKLLAMNSTGKTQVIEWLIRQLRQLTDERLEYAIKHAREIIADSNNREYRHASAIALFHIVSNLLDENMDKQERTKKLASYLGNTPASESPCFSNVTFAGTMRAFDFSRTSFHKCKIVDAELRNCRFSNQTKFVECTFEGTLAFPSCTDCESIVVQNEKCSKEAEYTLGELRQTGASQEVRQAFAEDALGRALKKFRGDYGLVGILARHHRSGFKVGNPYNEKVWDVFKKRGVVESHRISNVTEGGLHILDDGDLRREITTYLDNGIFGRRLKEVLSDLVK